jgi:hypothetical protein
MSATCLGLYSETCSNLLGISLVHMCYIAKLL